MRRAINIWVHFLNGWGYALSFPRQPMVLLRSTLEVEGYAAIFPLQVTVALLQLLVA